jgi:shikimate kinase
VKNVVLIGMPGCGKSTVGPLLGSPFLDSDTEIEADEGRSIPDIFAADGEGAFREAEKRVIARLSKLQGVVIATGGGAVKDPANMEALRRNGVIIFLTRPPGLIRTNNAVRPLSGSAAQWEALYRERLPLYRRYADITVCNDTTPEECAERILQVMKGADI